MKQVLMTPKHANKHIEIRSNISSNDLIVKTDMVRRFVRKGYKVNVLVKFARFMTSHNAYEMFVNNLRVSLLQLGCEIVGSSMVNNGEVAFRILGDSRGGLSC